MVAVPSRLTIAGGLTALAGLALLAWLIWWVGPGQIWDGFRQIGWGLLLIIAAGGLRFALRALAWMWCIEPPHQLRFRDAMAAVLSGDALGNVMILGPIVSEPAKAAFVRSRVPIGAALTALAVENVLYTLSVTAIIAAGTVALLLRVQVAEPIHAAGEVAIAAIAVSYGIALWVLWRRPAVLSRLVGAFERFSSAAGHARRLGKVRALEHDLYTFASRRRRALAPLAATELAFHALGVFEVHVTLWLLQGDAPPLLTSFILESVNRLITVVFKFVPLQVGVNEAGTALTTQVLGMGTTSGLTLGIVRKARVLVWTLVGAALLVRHGLDARQRLDPAPTSPAGPPGRQAGRRRRD
jgi:hypothetical protein